MMSLKLASRAVAAASALAIGPALHAQGVEPAPELVLSNYHIVRFDPVGDDRVELELTADVVNLDTGTWSSAGASWESPFEILEVVDGSLSFGPIAPLGTTPADDTLVARFPVAAADRFVDLLLAGELGLEVDGEEEVVYSLDLVAIDEETDLAFVPELSSDGFLVFAEITALLDGLAGGELLAIDGAAYEPIVLSSAWLPGEVVSVVRPGDGSVEVSLADVDLEAAIESGTFQVTETRYDSLIESTLGRLSYEDLVDGCEDQTHLPEPVDPTEPPNTACLFAGLPLRFNDVDLGQGVTLSGQVLLRAAPISLEVKVRDGAVRRVASTSEIGWTASLQLRSSGDATLSPSEQRVWTVVLPTYTVFIGPFPVTLTPTLEVLVGAEGSLVGEMLLNAGQSAALGLTAGWDDGELFAGPIVEVSPIRLSEPELADDQLASARVWAAAELSLEVDGVVGPSLRAAVFGDLSVSPFADPWYELDLGAELEGAFEISLLGFELARQALPLVSTAIPGSSKPRADGVDPSAGEDVRWATALTDGALPTENQRVDGLADGGVIVAGESPLSQGYLVRLDAHGDVVWERDLQSALPRRAVEQADGSLLVVGETRGDVVWSAGYDAQGSRLWDTSLDSADGCNVDGFSPLREASAGDLSMLVVGDAVRNFSFERDPCLIRLDSRGDPVWAKLLESPGSDSAYGVTRLADGDFIVVGSTEADVGDESLLNLTRNGLVVRVAPDGELVWAKAIASRWSLDLRSVVEADDGQLWITGEVNGVISDDYPALFVGRYAPDLSSGVHVLIAQDAEWEDYLDAEGGLVAPPWQPTGGGDTAYDRGLEILELAEGFVVAGSTGLGSDAAGWALRLTDELGVEWMVTIDGFDLDVFSGVADVGDGLVVAGRTESFVPLGVGGELAVLVAKLPYEGLLDLSVESLGVARYVQPKVFESWLDDDFDSTGGLQIADVAFTVVDTVLSAVGERPEPLEVTSTVTRLAD